MALVEATPVPVVAAATPPPVVKSRPVKKPAPAKPSGPSPEDVARIQARAGAVRLIESTRPLFVRRDFAGARQVLEKWLAEHPEQAQRTLVEHQVARMRGAEAAILAIVSQPAAVIGVKVPVGNTNVTISGVSHGRLTSRVQGQFGAVESPIEWASLTDPALTTVLWHLDTSQKAGRTPAFLLGVGKTGEAQALAAKADTLPNREELAESIVEFIQVTREAALLATLDGVDSLVDRGDLPNAHEQLRQCLASYSDHEFITILYAPRIAAWQARIASAPAPAPVKTAAAPAASDAYPGVPAFHLTIGLAVGDPDRQRLDAAAQWAARTGNWDRFFADLRTNLISAANTGAAMQRPLNIDRLVSMPTPALAVEEARFIRAVGPGALTAFCSNDDSREFVKWLFAPPQILASFNDTVEAPDKAGSALAQWRNIWLDDPGSRETQANLAIACAVVFDRPIRINPEVFGHADDSQSAARTSTTDVQPVPRFHFYRDAAKQGTLKVALSEMAPWELTWVVDAPVPDSELLWAQKSVHFTRHDWGKAYGHIRYRMDRATQGVNPYSAYTLAQIEKEGGICGDQAYFAAMTAKANGIPAMVIGGEGDRGAHAWFGYEGGHNEWNLNTGRYADNYAAGTTRDPQTRRPIKEHELRQLTDPIRRTEAYQRSEHCSAFARLLNDTDQRDLVADANELALRLAPTNYDAWVAHLENLATNKAPTQQWLRESARMRTAFAKYADIVQEINKREADYLADEWRCGRGAQTS